MPLFWFKCLECGKESAQLVSRNVKETDCECGAKTIRELPKSLNSTIYETQSRHHGKKAKKGISKQLRERSMIHHDKYEVAEKIDKYGIDEAKKHGWTKKAKKV